MQTRSHYFKYMYISPLPSVNANLDLVVSATQLLEALGLSPGQPVDHTHLASAVDLQEQVAYSMLHCAGTERVFTSQAEFQKVVTAARSLPHEVRQSPNLVNNMHSNPSIHPGFTPCVVQWCPSRTSICTHCVV